MKSLPLSMVLYSALAIFFSADAYADIFGSGQNSFEIEFVTVGNPGNPATDIDTRPLHAGSVNQTYRIGKHEISQGMIERANALGGLEIEFADLAQAGGSGENKPATGVSWFAAAKFVNWLNTSTGNAPAYKFDSTDTFHLWEPGDTGYNPNNLYRNSQAYYFLPDYDEWYKAAFYDPIAGVYYDYPTGSNIAPDAVTTGTDENTAVYGHSYPVGPADIVLAGGLSPYGTMAQGGNAWEWQENGREIDLGDRIESFRTANGVAWTGSIAEAAGSFRLYSLSPSDRIDTIGFRVASVPEPSSLLLGSLGIAGLLLRRTRVIRNTFFRGF